MADDFLIYPEYVPDIENYVAPNCMYLNVDDLSPFICSLSLSILMLNIRSLRRNFDNFIAHFYNYVESFSCIIFTETWLSEDRDRIFNIPGFYCCNLYRNHHGGGIEIYIKNCIQSKILENFTVINNLFEMLSVELLFCGCKFLLMTIYHPPTSCSKKNVEFVDFFTSYLHDLIELKLPLIIAGDTNLNLLNPSNNFYIDMYVNNLFEYNMRPLITKPSKVNLENPFTRFSILDQIWVSDDLITAQPFIIPISITDHFPVGAFVSSVFEAQAPTTVKRRIFSANGKEMFKVLLANIHVVMNGENMNLIYRNYYKYVFEAYNLSFPLVSGTIKNSHPAPWMSPKLMECIKKKAKLYKLYLKGRVAKADYTLYKNRLTNVVRRTKALYYARLFLENASNTKKVWNTINGLMNKRESPVLKEILHNGVVLRGEALANFTNEYFVNIAAAISAAVPGTHIFTCLAPRVLASCFLFPTSLNEVIVVMKNLRNKGSKILDIHPSIIKENLILFGRHFEVLYNLSVIKTVFPDMQKIARVCPVFKSGKPDTIDNYRPISSLPVFSKIFERLTLNRMESFISRHNILTHCQFGFRKGFSTTHAVIKLLSSIVQAYHQKVYSACFFLDLRKAFDTVNHELLIHKLEHYGFRGHFLKYLKSYYENRRQYVHTNGYDSSSRPVTCGVPQGSILGPLCFSLYINDMPIAVKEKVVLFADDAAFIITSQTVAGLYQKIRELFSDLYSYLSMNKLVPNSRKSKLMMFRSRPTSELPSLSFGGEEIEWITEFKYLGLTITNNMNFSKHINNISLNVSRMTGTFTCLRTVVPKNILMKLYYALIYPHLNNHVLVWGSAPPSHLKTLTVRLNNLLRTILGVTWENGRPLTSNNDLYKQLSVLKLESIFKLNLYKLLRLLLDGKLPEFWELLLANYVTSHAYNTRQVRFRHPNINCEVERRALSYQLITMLDELPPGILEINFNASLKQFKKIILSGQ